ncbi:spore germination protein [Cohnella cholangitidis]|uniref:Spore germination protein n=1 Tax=Cohnella cholangitidis TaxID=2598458 RepID=A0A7G5C1J0_9BACL|nr:spore germination protein [Cohnella cholangitidis]QMV43074.1 spore germination protein [Cohnella cholangitidis]
MPAAGQPLSGNLQVDLGRFKTLFDRSSDIVFKEFPIGGRCDCALIYVDGMVNSEIIDSDIIKPLLSGTVGPSLNEVPIADRLAYLESRMICSGQTTKGDRMDVLTENILSGDTVLLLDHTLQALIIGTRKWESRSVEEPASEPVIRGPREGFTENIRTNTCLVRRRLKTPYLKIEATKIGRLSRTDVAVVYLDHIAEKSIVDEVRERIGRIDIDAILESGYIEELIEDHSFSIFPQVLSTERPDRFAACLLEGKVGIIVDNTPFALMVPVTMFDLLHASEDYYQRYIPATATRWLRFVLSFSALVFPSLYIALLTFHQEMLPTTLLLSIAASREAVPFPAIVEAFLMEVAFEGLREAGVRLPRPIGQAVSIVGALVIGQAAVQAGIVSATLVIVVSFTGIASFIFPTYSFGFAIRMLRFPLMFAAGTLGLYGLLLGLLTILIHLARLRSFGVPFLSPLAPLSFSGLKDVVIRAPWWAMIKRPVQTAKRNRNRIKNDSRPGPPSSRN